MMIPTPLLGRAMCHWFEGSRAFGEGPTGLLVVGCVICATNDEDREGARAKETLSQEIPKVDAFLVVLPGSWLKYGYSQPKTPSFLAVCAV